MDDRNRLHEEVLDRLNRALNPVSLSLTDESHLHLGHGASGAHLKLDIVSPSFTGESMLRRHRLVFEALKGMLPGRIHALRVSSAYSPEEAPPAAAVAQNNEAPPS